MTLEKNEDSPQEDNKTKAQIVAEGDQDHGKMNNGTIGGSMGIMGSEIDQPADEIKTGNESTNNIELVE